MATASRNHRSWVTATTDASGQVADDRLADRPRRVQRVVLAEQSDRGPTRPGDPAAVGRLVTGQHPEEGGLPAAVATHDTDPLAGADAGRDRVEDGGGAVDDGRVLEGDEVGHVREEAE